MRSFFIDLENVRSYGLEGILLLKPEDKVYVFYSDNANTLTIPTIESLNESSAQVKYIKTNYIGANAMDFQIVTLLGASIEKEQTGKFYIISHDNGFKSAVKFCEGYFTGYDIVTGVFANILLAINSERNGKQGKISDSKADKNTGKQNAGNKVNTNQDSAAKQTVANSSDNSSDEKETSGNRNRRRRGRNQKSGRNHDALDQQNIDQNKILKAEDSRMTDSALSISSDQETVNGITSSNIINGDVADNTADTEIKKSKSRNRRRRGRNHDRSETEAVNTVSENNNQSDVSEANGTEDGFMIIQANSDQDDQKENHKSSRNSRRRSKGKQQRNQNSDAENSNGNQSITSTENNESTKQTAGTTKSSNGKPVTTAKYSGNYKYVHDALSDFLSKTTIDMYAAKIDEGIKSSANRNELHAFFKKSYGQDEAEALYKIIASDFDKMKKEAGK